MLRQYLLSGGESVVYEFNEWDYILSLQDKSTEDLTDMGYTSEDIDFIKNFRVANEIQKLQALPDNQLLTRGYSQEEISELKGLSSISLSSNSTEAQLSARDTFGAARLKMYITVEKLQSTLPNSYAVIYTEWAWEKVPHVVEKDASFIGWNQNMRFMDQHPNKSRRTLYRKDYRSNEVRIWTSGFFRNYENYHMNKAVQIGLFSLGDQVCSEVVHYIDAKNGEYATDVLPIYDFTYKGCARVALEKNALVHNIQANLSYSHSIVKLNSISYTFDTSTMNFKVSPNMYKLLYSLKESW